MTFWHGLLPMAGYLLGSLAFAVWLPRCVAGVAGYIQYFANYGMLIG